MNTRTQRSPPLLPRNAPSARRTALWLFASFQLFYLLGASGRLHTIDEYETFYMTESLAERGELALGPGRAFFGRKSEDGRFFAPYGPVPAAAALPGYWLGKLAGRLVAADRARESLLWCFTSVTNTTFAAAAVTFLFLAALRLGARIEPALLAATVLGVATPHWHYATTFFSEPLAACLLLASLWCLAVLRSREKPWRAGDLAAASLPAALLAGTRLSHAVYLPPLSLAVLALSPGTAARRVRAAAAYSALPALAAGLYLLWNEHRFGDPFQPGYPARVEGARSPVGFETPLLTGLYGLLLSPGKGLFLFAPPVLAGLAFARGFMRRGTALAWWVLAFPLVPLLFFARYSYWEGGYSWGPRYLVPVLGAWILPLAFLEPRRLPVGLATLLAAGSASVQALGVSVSFLECQVRHGYYDAAFRYRLDYPALRETWKVCRHYLEASLEGRFLDEPEGLGFDRWFFFLRKTGIPPGILWSAALLVALGWVAATALLVREAARREAAPPRGPPPPIRTRGGEGEDPPGRDGDTPHCRDRREGARALQRGPAARGEP